jgi:hypothetical protein
VSTTTLSTAELAQLLDVTEVQLLRITPRGAYPGDARAYTPETIRRLQVAASLAHAIPNPGGRQSVFPAVARVVLDHPEEPRPPTWAVLRGDELAYVLYRADVAGAVGGGGVVVEIDRLWPDLPETEE